VTLLGAIAGAGYAVLSGHTYAATAQVLVTPPNQGALSGSAQQVSNQANMSTEEAIAQSPQVVFWAARLLHVEPSALRVAAAKQLTVNVPATTLTTSNVLQITWEAKSPAAAATGANAFANAYLSYRRQLRANQIEAMIASLSQRLGTVAEHITVLYHQLVGTSKSSRRHVSLYLRLKQLESVQAAYNNKIASLSPSSDSGGSLMAAARPLTSTGLSHKVIPVLGGLLGLLIGLVLAFVRDAFDRRIRDAAQFEQKLGAPVLAVLPPDASLPDDGRDAGRGAPPSVIVTAADPESQAAEAVRTLRATLAAMAARRPLQALLIVAADASVSASLLAAALGVALAESGRRVLLVAANIRGSVLPQIFDVPNNVGLSDLLVGGGDLEVRKPHQVAGVVLPGQVAEQLTVLPPGPKLASALAGLDSPVMQRLVRRARDAHDFVLLDSPPITAAADAYELAVNVDGVIVVARERRSRGRAVEELSRRLDRMGADLVGGVLVGKGRARRRPRPRVAEPLPNVELDRGTPVSDANGQRRQQPSGTRRSPAAPAAVSRRPPTKRTNGS
jgi:Mrp family chromosome partitioning ATPase/capsular polysaccharide biosynthesis protein